MFNYSEMQSTIRTYYHYRLLRRSSTNTQETHRNMTHGRKTIVVIQDEILWTF